MIKWIGQHIVDLIARFRSDVYLEEVSTGTIASGGNLGLDSNNKIVKANEPTSHDAVTLAGSLDYITLSGQEITRNYIDLTQDVTGTLGATKGGTGLTSISTLLNSNVTSVSGNAGTATALATARNIAGVSFDGTANISLNNDAITNGAGYTTNTGDITSVQFSSSVGSHTESSGAAAFILAGAAPLTFTNVNETFTVSVSNASASAKGVVELATTAEADTGTDTARAVTPAGLKSHVDAKFAYQYISFTGNVTANTSGNSYWEYPTANGISNHTWTQIVKNTTGGVNNRDTTTVGDEVGIDRLNQGSAGVRIPYAGTIVGFTGGGRNASGDRVYYAGLFVGTPDWGTTNDINAELVAVAAADNNSGSYHSRPSKLEDLSRSYSIAAGDVIYPVLKGSGTNADILQVNMTVVIKTPLA